MKNFNTRYPVILFSIALGLFLISRIFIYNTLDNLEEAIKYYQGSVENLAKVEMVRENSHSYRPPDDSQAQEELDFFKDRKDKVERSLNQLANDFDKDEEQKAHLWSVKGYWQDIDEKGEDASGKGQVMESTLEQITDNELKKIHENGPLLIKLIEKLIPNIILVSVITLPLLCYAFYILWKENQDKIILLQQLSEARDLAEKNAQYVTRFMATVSHELRTPLNAIIGLTEILMTEKKFYPEVREKIELINKTGNTLLKIISETLNSSKIESGEFKIEKNEFDLVQTIEDIISTLKVKAEQKMIDLVVEHNLGSSFTTIGDKARIEQVLYNLIGNAIKFTSRGYVKLVLNDSGPKKELGEERTICFSVIDTGIGIPKSQISNLFRPFFQVDTRGTRGEPGSGLGLSISQKIIQKMGGTITVDSTETLGSTFSFELRLPKTSKILEQKNEVSFDEIFTKSITALVVEDDLINQKVLESMLEKFGVKSVLVESGRDAIDFIQTHHCDMVFMDYQMPGMNGSEAISKIRKHEEKIPIIACTASALDEVTKRMLAAGADGILFKPFTLRELREILVKVRGKISREGMSSHEPNKVSKEKIEELYQLLGKDKFFDLFQLFCSNLKDLTPPENQDSLDEFKKRCHKLKSSAALFGLLDLAELFSQGENQVEVSDGKIWWEQFLGFKNWLLNQKDLKDIISINQ